MTTLAARPASVLRISARLLGNVFLGIAVGLVGYYWLTDLVTANQQSELRAQLPPVAYEHSVVWEPEEEQSPFDFEGWEEEDRAYWKRLPDGEAFGRLVCERMGLDAVVVKGTTAKELAKGPGWIKWSDLPGPTGNTGIAGHRTTYSAPFRPIDELQEGDTIVFYSPYRRYTYQVARVFVVTPDRVDVVRSTDEPTLTMTACHPPGSARERIIAQSELVEVRRLGE
jgi:LPXTG-site transpeptidase (sortase) family protein